MAEKRAPLKGLKYLDLGWIVVEPLAAKYLADWGATVVRLETHARPDILRVMMPFKDGISGIDRGSWWNQSNSSKLGISLNLNKPKAKEIIWKLIMWADAMGQGYAPGMVKRWGFDYETVSKVRPDIVYLSTSQMGQTGPKAAIAGWGWMSTAVAGIPEITGWPDRGPSPPQGAYSDFYSPRFESTTVLAALEYKRRTGKGQHVEQSQMETSTLFMAPAVMDYRINGRVMNRNGNRLSYAAPHGAYRCQGNDRWCAIGVFTEEEWKGFCLVIGEPGWTKDPKFATLAGRKENEDELERLVEEWTILHTAEQVEEMMQRVGVAANVVENCQDLFEDPQLKHRNYWRYFKHSVIGLHAYQTYGFLMSKSPDGMFTAPALGEHNEYVFKEILHLSDDDIAEALIEGAITTEADLPEFGISI